MEDHTKFVLHLLLISQIFVMASFVDPPRPDEAKVGSEWASSGLNVRVGHFCIFFISAPGHFLVSLHSVITTIGFKN